METLTLGSLLWDKEQMPFFYLIGKNLESLVLADTLPVLFTFESAQIYLIHVILFSVL